jgi:hypothetical protein
MSDATPRQRPERGELGTCIARARGILRDLRAQHEAGEPLNFQLADEWLKFYEERGYFSYDHVVGTDPDD